MPASPLLRVLISMMVFTATWAALIPVSVRDPGRSPAITGNGASGSGMFVGDEHHVLFLSSATDLAAPAGRDTVLQLYLRDLKAGRTELVSMLASGVPGDGSVMDFSASQDGRRIAFTWAADEVAAGDTNGRPDVYLRDLDTGKTTLVSVRKDGVTSGNGRSDSAEISADGRFVVFESEATDLADGPDENGGRDVFVRDLDAGTTEWISRIPAGVPFQPPATARNAVISPDGSLVAFVSESLNITPVEGFGTSVLLWRRGVEGVRRVRLPVTTPASLPALVEQPVLSADGSVLAFAVFESRRNPSEVAGVWRMDLATGTVLRVSGNLPVSWEMESQGPVLSRDGSTLAFSVDSGTGVGGVVTNQVRIWKAGSGLHTLDELVQTLPPGGAPEPAQSQSPVLSPDGASLVFVSEAAVPGSPTEAEPVRRWYHRILATGATRVLSDDVDSISPAFSPDGSRLVFEEQVPVLTPGDVNEELDVVVATLSDGSRAVVSLLGAPTGMTMASGSSMGGGGISDDGRHVLFTSQAEDLVALDSNRSADAFVFDSLNLTNRTVAILDDGSAAGRMDQAVLSGDGRFVAFQHDGGGLVPDGSVMISGIFRRDLVTGALELVSARDGTGEGLGTPAYRPLISADGQWVGFQTAPAGPSMILLRHPETRRTWWLNDPARTRMEFPQGTRMQISADGSRVLFREGATTWYLLGRTAGGFEDVLTFSGADAWMSADGRVVYSTKGATSANPGFYRRLVGSDDRERLVEGLPADIAELSVSADGSVFACTARLVPGGALRTNPLQIRVFSAASGAIERISVNASGEFGNGDSREPMVSADGRFVSFRSEASDLVVGDTNAMQDIFVHDRYTGQTRIVSVSGTGIQGDRASTRPQISRDGRRVTFTTFAANLLPGDRNGLGDVVLAEIPQEPAPDTDGDGLPDGWERDQFGSLDRDGAGDPDGDGVNNAVEFAARTVPTEAASRLVISGVRVMPDGIEVTWPGHAGVGYRLERLGSLESGSTWEPVGTEVAGYEGAVHRMVPEAGSGAFFRVALASKP